MTCRYKTYCKDCKYRDKCVGEFCKDTEDGCCNGVPGFPDSAGYCSENYESICKLPNLLICNSCGNRPLIWKLIRRNHKIGDQCPCCYLDDYDCDGILEEPSLEYIDSLVKEFAPQTPSKWLCNLINKEENK